jgi:purine-binding chemotaxis protein CheW
MPRSLPAHDPHRLDRILDARTRQLAARDDAREGGGIAAGPAPIPGLACTLGSETYGLPLTDIAQVVPFTPLTPTPGAPPAMLGLLGRNGQVFIVLDLATALGAAALGAGPTAQPAGHLLLLRHGPRRFALRVDRATGAIEAMPAEAPTEVAPHRAVTGHALAPGGALLGLIDLERLLRPYLATAATAPSAPSLSSTNGSVTP